MPRKTEKLTIRIDPTVKEALRLASGNENRSVANMIEVLIRDHCKQKEIPIETSSSTSQKSRDGNARTDETAKKISRKGRA